jgi:glycosyltransferase involved in cell wall biosynthesis
MALLPAWRAERFIESTLEALAAQTYGNLHILISDDASPDSTAELCEAFAVRTPRTRVIRQTRNLGWVGNSNALLQAAQRDYYFFALPVSGRRRPAIGRSAQGRVRLSCGN